MINPLAESQKGTLKPLSQKQLDLLEAASGIGFGRNVVKICEEADVSRTCFYKWMREDDQFIAAYEALPMKMVNKHLPGIISAQLFAANAGDTKAARLMLDYAGLLKQRLEHSGPGGNPIKHEHQVISQPERQKGIMEILDRAGALNFESLPSSGGNGHGDGNGF